MQGWKQPKNIFMMDQHLLSINHLALLLMVINLVALTSTSLSFQNAAGGATMRGMVVLKMRRVRSIEEERSKGPIEDEKSSPMAGMKSWRDHGKTRSHVFSTENSTIVLAQIGGTASLPCVVRKNSGTVLWLRQWPSGEPATLLSVGVNKHTADDRYYVEHVRHLQNWELVIKPVRFEDEGMYKCQVSTHPPTVILIQLKVTKAYAVIVGAPDLHLHVGSALHLACSIRESTEPPAYVFWYHEDRMINYDAGVLVLTNSASNVLIVPDADKSHNGNYTCKPSNAVPAYINVHVLNATEEENPAAMLHSNSASSTRVQGSLFCRLIGLAVLLCLRQRRAEEAR